MSPRLASNFALSPAREADLHFSMILGTASAFRQVGNWIAQNVCHSLFTPVLLHHICTIWKGAADPVGPDSILKALIFATLLVERTNIASSPLEYQTPLVSGDDSLPVPNDGFADQLDHTTRYRSVEQGWSERGRSHLPSNGHSAAAGNLRGDPRRGNRRSLL